MTWKYTTTTKKLLRPSDAEWTPTPHQIEGVDFLIHHQVAALWADPGSGKTSITLTAFVELQDAGMARKMLVLAPLRVCQLVWRQEAAKWPHTRHLKTVLVHGKNKEKLLREDADVYLVNYEAMDWLARQMRGRPWPFDVVVSDELTKLKNSRGKRVKALKPHIQRARRRWGLTGTPAPNGYLDLFGQFMFLDDGAALGRYFTHYRNTYFNPGFDGFTWEIRDGAEEEIQKRLDPYVYRIEYTNLPELVDVPHIVDMDKEARQRYKQMREAMLIEVEGKLVTAANAAATFAKLRQMANGAVYTSPQLDEAAPLVKPKVREWVHIHDAKLDALEALLEELDGKPLLVAYSFQHDLARIRERFGHDIPVLGSGVTEDRAIELQDAWNRGEIPLMLCHPDSVGHGLNLQQGNAEHVCWFSADFNLELYDQFKRRVWRQGNKAEKVYNHRLIVKGTIDELVYAALEDKEVTQARLLQSVKKVLGAQTPAGGVRPVTDEGADMAINRRLPTKADAEGDEAPRTARGWGRPATEEDEAPRQTQRAAISSKLRGRDVEEEEGNEEEEASRPSSRFSGGLRGRMAGSDAGEDAPEEADKPEPRTRARAVGRAVEAEAVPTPPLNTAQTAGEQPLYVHVAINVSGPQELVDEYLRKIAG